MGIYANFAWSWHISTLVKVAAEFICNKLGDLLMNVMSKTGVGTATITLNTNRFKLEISAGFYQEVNRGRNIMFGLRITALLCFRYTLFVTH